jgi:multidrug efflux pump subunit AcrA (membrane-fusion protein)
MPESHRRTTRHAARRASSRSQRGRGRIDVARRILTVTAALGISIAGVAAWKGATSKEPTRDYASAAVARADVEDTISALGSIQPREFVDVGTQVSGQLRRLLVNVGDQVKAGARLVGLRIDQANLAYTRIVAPMSGTVVSVPVRQGQTVNASQQAPVILRLANLDTMTVVTQVSEADVVRLVVGMEVYFSTLGAPQRRWLGRVRQILPMPETVNNVVLYGVLFDVDNKGQDLKPQMSAQVSFVAAQAKGALVVPVSALQRRSGKTPGSDEAGGSTDSATASAEDSTPATLASPASGESRGERKSRRPAGSMVLVLKDGRVEERRVQLGVANRNQVQVLSGLAEGEQVVVERVATGVRVKDATKRSAKS